MRETISALLYGRVQSEWGCVPAVGSIREFNLILNFMPAFRVWVSPCTAVAQQF